MPDPSLGLMMLVLAFIEYVVLQCMLTGQNWMAAISGPPRVLTILVVFICVLASIRAYRGRFRL